MSLLASFLNEAWVDRFNYRGRFLRRMLDEIFSDPINRDFTSLLYKHPLIAALFEKGKKLPVYIPTHFFSRALVETMADYSEKQKIVFEQDKETLDINPVIQDSPQGLFDKYKEAVKDLKHSQLKILLHSFLMNATNKGELLKESENWFEAYMTQGSYWYKAKMQTRLFIVSIFLVIFTQFDVIITTQQIFNNDILRERISNVAILFSQENKSVSSVDAQSAKEIMDELKKDIKLPIGWDSQPFQLRNIFGWLLSAVLISFGAPFWFDLLGKIVNVRKISSAPSNSKS
jgi:hypothetical protein